MASLQYEDPDVYEEVQVAGASKGADAPVGGSFNNFIVKSGGNDLHGLFFYDREPLDLQSSNLSPELEAQGRHQHQLRRPLPVGARGRRRPDRARQVLVVLCLPQPELRQLDAGLLQHRTPGQPEPVFTTLRNHATKLNYRLNSNHTLAYSAQYNSKSLPNSGASAFRGFGVDVADRLPVLDPGRDPHVDSLQPIDARGEVG